MTRDLHRKLTTILAADAAGYSRLMESNEVRTFGLLQASREIFSRLIERHDGRIVDTAGDGLIAEFPSVVEAVQCAVEAQRELDVPPSDRGDPLRFRIGIHLGDVMVHGKDLVGEGVNLAARLQSMAEPGGILMSRQVYDQVHTKLTVGFDYIGEKRPKNFSEDVSVYQVSMGQPQRIFEFARKTATKVRPAEPPKPQSAAASRSRQDIVRNAKIGGILLVSLAVLDIATGSSLWFQWPGTVVLALLGLQAAPLLVKDKRAVAAIRLGVIGLGLVLINVFSWQGYFWALWPLGAITALFLLWRVAVSRD